MGQNENWWTGYYELILIPQLEITLFINVYHTMEIQY